MVVNQDKNLIFMQEQINIERVKYLKDAGAMITAWRVYIGKSMDAGWSCQSVHEIM